MTSSIQSIFISYARKDVEVAERIYHSLKLYGLNPWLDKFCILPGQRWKSEIRRAIRNSSHFVALLSAHSVSKRGYVHKEVREALSVVEESPESDIFIIPVRLDDCTPSHEALNEFNWIDLFPSFQAGFEKLLNFFKPDINVPFIRKDFIPSGVAEQTGQESTRDIFSDSRKGSDYGREGEREEGAGAAPEAATSTRIDAPSRNDLPPNASVALDASAPPTDPAANETLALASQAMMLVSMEYDLELQIQYLIQHRIFLRKAIDGFTQMQSEHEPNSRTHLMLSSRIDEMRAALNALTFRIDGLRMQKEAISRRKEEISKEESL